MTTTNMIEAVRPEISLVGKEIEFGSGIRAVAARYMMEDRLVNRDDIFEWLEDSISNDHLFESYHSAVNPKEELLLGRGLPLPSIEAYVMLRSHYGDEWLLEAITDYCAYFGSIQLRSRPEQNAKELLTRAFDNYGSKYRTPAHKSAPRNAIETLGREFEDFGGLRPLALNELLSCVHPEDCPEIMSDACKSAMGEIAANEGTSASCDLYDICDDCYGLRISLGRDWMRKGLQTYLTKGKGLGAEEAVVECSRLLSAASRRYAEVVALQVPIRKAEKLDRLLSEAERHESELARLREEIQMLSVA